MLKLKKYLKFKNETNALKIIAGDDVLKLMTEIDEISQLSFDVSTQMMKDLAKEFPQYLWESNVGYGTKDHMEAIEKNGLSKHHRKTFCSRFNSSNSLI